MTVDYFLEIIWHFMPWVIVLLCIISEAFFAASELSILSADKMTLESQAEQGDLAAARVLWFKSHPDQLFGTTLLGTNISTVTGSTIASLVLLSYWQTYGELIAMLVMSPLVLMGGEILPKSLAQSQALKFAKLLSKPLKLFNTLLKPLIVLVTRYTQWLSKRFNLPSGTEGVTRDELIFLVQEDNQIEEEERQLISKIFAFKQLSAQDVAIPLAEVEALPQQATVQQAAESIMKHGFSRIPIYQDRIDQIVGVVHHLDLLNASGADVKLSELMRPVIYATELQDVDDLLGVIQSESASLVIVVDEFGAATGLITLEDLIEEIVGEIDDEFDEQAPWWKLQNDRSYLIEARTSIDEINQTFALGIPLSEDYDTIAGYVLAQLRRIPERGDWVDTPLGYKVEVTQAHKRGITQVSIRASHHTTIKIQPIHSEG